MGQNAPCRSAASPPRHSAAARGVHVGQQQVSPDLSEVAEVGEQRPYDGLGLAAVGHAKSPYSTRVTPRIRRRGDRWLIPYSHHPVGEKVPEGFADAHTAAWGVRPISC